MATKLLGPQEISSEGSKKAQGTQRKYLNSTKEELGCSSIYRVTAYYTWVSELDSQHHHTNKQLQKKVTVEIMFMSDNSLHINKLIREFNGIPISNNFGGTCMYFQNQHRHKSKHSNRGVGDFTTNINTDEMEKMVHKHAHAQMRKRHTEEMAWPASRREDAAYGWCLKTDLTFFLTSVSSSSYHPASLF